MKQFFENVQISHDRELMIGSKPRTNPSERYFWDHSTHGMRENDRSALQTCLRLVQARKIWKSYDRVTRTIHDDLGGRFVDFSKLASQHRFSLDFYKLDFSKLDFSKPAMTYLGACGDNLFLLQRLVKMLQLSLTCPDIPNCLFLYQKRKTGVEIFCSQSISNREWLSSHTEPVTSSATY